MIKINNIKNHDWKGTKVSILGAGKSGIAAAKLCNKIGAKPFISDSNTSPTLIKRVNNFANELGGHTTKVFDAELIIISPGVPNTIEVVKECEKENLPIISEIEFASWFTESPIIAVTGSNGKSTTVSLIHEIFQFAGYNSFLGGNLDKAFSELVVDELNNKATSLFIYSGEAFKREIILSSILNEFENLYFHDWQNITSLWEKYCIHKNNTITFHNGEEFLQGEFQGITNSGYAKIKLNGKIETFPAGMITL